MATCRICKGTEIMKTTSTKLPEAPCPCVWPPEVMEYVKESVIQTLQAGHDKLDEEGWLFIGEAAKRMDRSKEGVRQMCATGRLRATRTSIGWRIHPDVVQAWIDSEPSNPFARGR